MPNPLSLPVAQAALLPDPGTAGVTQATGSVNPILEKLQTSLLDDVYLLLGAIAVILLIVAGIQYMTSGGDPGKTKLARASILNVVAGIVLLSASYLIIQVVTNVAHFVSGKL